jgi:hypothetical protein
MNDPGSCHVHVYSDDYCTIEVNLGWCNNMNELWNQGSIVHEIGHAIGMNHEQKRPDAIANYKGVGPFLKINWDMVEEDWKSQWTGEEGSYIGSANDGTGDPVVGYATYDYDSIMHYPTQGEAETIPPGSEHRLGAGTTASRLSPGDIAQAKDQYQCRSRASAGGQRGAQPPATTPCYDSPVFCDGPA